MLPADYIASTFLFLSAFFRVAPKSTVQFGSTTLNGASYLNGSVEFYGGIPYAEPPLGDLRFKPPVYRRRLTVPTLNASAYGMACLQPTTSVSNDTGSEDCLTINVYKPAGLAKDVTLPVMAWIHGGGFKLGASYEFNATELVAQSIARGTPIVYVNFNYRLGPLGFAPGREALEQNALNLGLRDQLAALKWVQDNIAFFNGDKDKVTVFGESAGAISAGVLHLNSNLKGLAHAMILESGSPGTGMVYDAHRRQADWDNFVHAIPECAHRTSDSIACLQQANVSTSDILQAYLTANAESAFDYPWVPTLDGPDGLLPDLPSVLMDEGRFTRVPFITGTVLDEGTLFATPHMSSAAMIHSYLISNYSASDEIVDKLIALYPDDPAFGSPFGTGDKTFGLNPQWKRYAAIIGDLLFISHCRAIAQNAAKFGIDAFGYRFNDAGAQPVLEPFFSNIPADLSYLGVAHTTEIPYVYGYTSLLSNPPSAAPLARMIADYWLSFATSLNPNDGLGINRPQWPKYTVKYPTILQLSSANTSAIPDDFREAQIEFINSNAKALRR
ncbi:esterase 1 [Mycena pura]|uniref:Esterase 1 n=1 Tax=Mycena pura TaxID=153505 RepID=A0AAD6YV62_9AGAR|nr:esterase 1 [Mycena pura]